MRRLALSLALFLGLASPVFAQAVCPIQGHSALVVTGTTYTIGGTNLCRTLVFTSGSAVAVALPYPTTFGGMNFWFKVFAEGAGTVTITPAGVGATAAPLINGSTTLALATTHSATIYFATDGNWYATYAGG